MSRSPYALSCMFAWLAACAGASAPESATMNARGDDARDEEGLPDEGPGEDDGDDSAEEDASEMPAEDDTSLGDDAGTDEPCNTVLKATVRDFRAEHADFGNLAFISDVSLPGIVEDELGPDRKPVYASAGSTEETTGPAEFAQWYNDVPDVNMAFEVDIPLGEEASGTFVFDSQKFFPLDGKGFAEEDLDADGQRHNFLFTTEIHTAFTYRGGETFTFNGDDDVWVFINGKLAIDLGGLHPKLLDSVSLDEAAERLGITPGEAYPMDIFHAERLAKDSTFRIETTIECLVAVPAAVL